MLQRKISESDARYRGLLEAASDAMIVADQHGAIVPLNVQAERRFGYRRDELEGKGSLHHSDGFTERLIADAARSAAEGAAWPSIAMSANGSIGRALSLR